MQALRYEKRSTEAPMDFEYTSPNRELPINSPFRRGIEAATAEKRSRMKMEMNSAGPSDTSQSYSFGTSTSNVPFLFNVPTPSAPVIQWTPRSAHVDVPDIQMGEPSPPKKEQAQEEVRPIALGAIKRVYNKRVRDSGRRHNASRVGHDGEAEDYASDDDEAEPTNPNPNPSLNRPHSTSNHYTLNLGSSSSSSSLPYHLLGYAQFSFNISLIMVFLYLLITFILTVQRDVEQRIAEYSLDILRDIALCTTSYTTNNCANPLPALVNQCLEWEKCIARDPAMVGRAKVGAEMLAEVINSFVEPISWKTLLFSLSSVAFFTVFVNSILALYRTKYNPNHHSHATHLPMPPYSYGPSQWWPPEIDELPARRRKMLNGEAKKVQ